MSQRGSTRRKIRIPAPQVAKISDQVSKLSEMPERLATLGYYSWQNFRRQSAHKKGHEPTVLAFLGYGSQQWVRVLSRVVLAPGDAFISGRRRPTVVQDGVRGWRNFVSPPMAYAEIHVELNGTMHTVRADRNGVLDVVVDVSLVPGWHTATLHVAGGESTVVDILIIGDHVTRAVICDVDDTVVNTALPRPMRAAWNSFVLDEHARTPTPGMSTLLNRLVDEHLAPVIYVSTGAWNVAQTLMRFMTRNLFPLGPLLLTAWGPTEDRWFRSGVQHKIDALERLTQDFPNIEWLLIGDDGQHDPEIYTHFARRHPEKVSAIAIRQLTPSEALLAGGRAEDTRHATPGVSWVYGPDGASLALQFQKLGLLDVEEVDSLRWPKTVYQEERRIIEEYQSDNLRYATKTFQGEVHDNNE